MTFYKLFIKFYPSDHALLVELNRKVDSVIEFLEIQSKDISVGKLPEMPLNDVESLKSFDETLNIPWIRNNVVFFSYNVLNPYTFA